MKRSQISEEQVIYALRKQKLAPPLATCVGS